jgi:hypothetical protein
MAECPASGQSGTEMKKNAGAGNSPVPRNKYPVRFRNAPVPDWDVSCRTADAGMPKPSYVIMFCK